MKKIFILSELLFIQIFVSAQMTPTFDEIIETNSLQLDLSELSRGSYLVKIKSGNKIATRKIIKK